MMQLLLIFYGKYGEKLLWVAQSDSNISSYIMKKRCKLDIFRRKDVYLYNISYTR